MLALPHSFFARLSIVFERFIRSETCAFVSVDVWKEQSMFYFTGICSVFRCLRFIVDFHTANSFVVTSEKRKLEDSSVCKCDSNIKSWNGAMLIYDAEMLGFFSLLAV